MLSELITKYRKHLIYNKIAITTFLSEREIPETGELPIRMPQEYNEQVYTLYFQLYDKMDSERGKLVKVQNSYSKRVE